MSTTSAPRHDLDLGVDEPRRLSTETKASTKTTELIVFLAVVLGIVVTANAYDGDGSHGDPFGATTAMRYIVYVTIAYLVSRGLAKSGSQERYSA